MTIYIQVKFFNVVKIIKDISFTIQLSDLYEAQNSHQQHFENDIKLKNKLKKWFETYENSQNKVNCNV